MRILVIEDEPDLRSTLTQGLREESYAVDVAADGEEGLHMAECYPYDAIVLDLMLPKLDGLTLLEKRRREGDVTPVLILTARDALEDKIEGFRRGTDDYLTKPFAFAELVARLASLIRRSHGVAGKRLLVSDLEIDMDRREVRRAGQRIVLTATEYGMLEHFALNPDRVISRTELSEHLWSHDWEKMSNVLDVHVANLRRKIDAGREESLLQTVRGAGYALRNS
jgi:DNA-binding response OmpR family regulator